MKMYACCYTQWGRYQGVELYGARCSKTKYEVIRIIYKEQCLVPIWLLYIHHLGGIKKSLVIFFYMQYVHVIECWLKDVLEMLFVTMHTCSKLFCYMCQICQKIMCNCFLLYMKHIICLYICNSNTFHEIYSDSI